MGGNERNLKSKNTRRTWWSFSVQKGEVTRHSQALLSQHVLNLRNKADQPLTESLAHMRRQVASFTINLKNYPKVLPLQLPFELPSLNGWAFTLEQTSVWAVLEFIWLLLSIAWYLSLWFFFKLASEIIPLAAAIALDVKSFLIITGRIIYLPFSLVELPKIKFPQFSISQLSFQRGQLIPLGFFLALALMLTLPVKGIATYSQVLGARNEVLNLAEQAVGSLNAGSLRLSNGEPELAKENFEQASTSFTQALNILSDISDKTLLLARFSGESSKLSSAQSLLEASREISEAATAAAKAWQRVNGASTADGFAVQVSTLQTAMRDILPHVTKALAHLRAVKASELPSDIAARVTAVQNQADTLESILNEAATLPDFFQQILVTPEPATYVLVFQNPAEIRPTGGFMGSLAFIKLNQGKIEQVQVPGGGPYEYQNVFKKILRPPEPLRLLKGVWQLQDANWFFDFPHSAQKILWFLNDSGLPEPQGVIALNAEVVVELLRLTGPIEVPRYRKTVDANNFLRATQEEVEINYNRKDGKPKQFIADLAPILLNRVITLPNSQQLAFTKIIDKALRQRSIQVYLNNASLQKKLIGYGWAGTVREVPMDYLAIVRANIGGAKSDAVIDETLRHEVEVTENGNIIVRLEFTRQHLGDPRDIFTGFNNKDYLRFYVPKGSTLISAEGFSPMPLGQFAVPPTALKDEVLVEEEEKTIVDQASQTRISQEYDKTVFSNWLNVSPKESRTVRLTYQLPYVLSSGSGLQDLRRYQVYFQRQSGVKPMDFRSALKLPRQWRLRWHEASKSATSVPNGIEVVSDWTQDEYYGAVLEKLTDR